MSAKNTNVEYMSKSKAMQLLGITSQGAYSAAQKTHPYLKPIRERHPETDSLWSKVSMEAVERYMAERKTNGNSGSRDGMIMCKVRIPADQLEEAARVLSEHFGKAIEVERLHPRKVEDAEDAEDAETEDDDEGDEAEA
jgi:hypothetical protein